MLPCDLNGILRPCYLSVHESRQASRRACFRCNQHHHGSFICMEKKTHMWPTAEGAFRREAGLDIAVKRRLKFGTGIQKHSSARAVSHCSTGLLRLRRRHCWTGWPAFERSYKYELFFSTYLVSSGLTVESRWSIQFSRGSGHLSKNVAESENTEREMAPVTRRFGLPLQGAGTGNSIAVNLRESR